MKKLLVIVLWLCCLPLLSQEAPGLNGVIPKPSGVELQQGSFKLSASTKFYISPGSDDLKAEMKLFNHFLLKNNGFEIAETTAPLSNNLIQLTTDKSEKQNAGRESYSLHITVDKVFIKGSASGIFYALQTIRQMIGANGTPAIELPCAVISDAPQYQWRGMHLDVCRHFFPKEFVMHYIDLLALYKLNTFHWHLTDDQGWRIEIKKYPRLTQIGAWRSGSMVGKYSEHQFDTLRYGGFYTQQDIKEVVAYAAQRHITVVPEIEMPGHCVAAIAAYPFLSCSGKKIDVEKSWGVFEDVYCTKDSTFTFLQDVLTEVMALFPSKFIHIGGDECPKESWKKCAHCQERIKREKLKDEHELQSYFIRRIEKFVNANGRQIIGWDEILEGGLAPNAAVMSWRGTEGGIAAAKQKHYVVMSPGKPCYFDHYQVKDRSKEPLAIGGYNPIDSVYAYNPVPPMLSANERRYILGAQANLWTEYILDEKQAEYMLLPRMCALAEALWTKPVNKNYPDFIKRLKTQTEMMDKMNLNYARHFLNNKQ